MVRVDGNESMSYCGSLPRLFDKNLGNEEAYNYNNIDNGVNHELKCSV